MGRKSGERRAARFRPRPLACSGAGFRSGGCEWPGRWKSAGPPAGEVRRTMQPGDRERGCRALPSPSGCCRAGLRSGVGGWSRRWGVGRTAGRAADREVRRIAAADRRRQDDGGVRARRRGMAGGRAAAATAGTPTTRHRPSARRQHESRAGPERVRRTRRRRHGYRTVPAQPAGGTGGTGRTDREPREAGSGSLPPRLRSRAGGTQGQRPRVERRTMRPLLFMTPTVLPSVASFASWRSLSFATAMYTGPR